MNSLNTIKAGLTAIADPEGREFTAQVLLNMAINPGCSGQNEWTQYEHSRNQVLVGEPHRVLKKGTNGVDLMQGPVPCRPKPAPRKEGRDQSEDYILGAQYQVVGLGSGHRVVWAVYNWFGQRVTAYARTYDLAHKWKEFWQNEYERTGRYLKGNSTDERVAE